MSSTPKKETILIYNFNVDEKILIRFKKFYKKKDQIVSFFQKLRLKVIGGLTWYFWTKIKTKNVIP